MRDTRNLEIPFDVVLFFLRRPWPSNARPFGHGPV